MKMFTSKTFFILLCIASNLILITHQQSQCRVNRMPEVIPLQYGEQGMINLQEYISGPNITYSVQPNDFYSNIQPQYTCKQVWSHQLGRIIQTEEYQVKLNNKTQQLVAMLGGSVYNPDVFHIYYGINVTEFQLKDQEGVKNKRDQYEANEHYTGSDNKFDTYQEQMLKNLNENDVLVVQIPRFNVKNCQQLSVISNSSHLQFIVDCESLSQKLSRVIATTTVISNANITDQKWELIEAPIYLPDDLIPKLHITTALGMIQTSKTMRYLVRMVMSEWADYIEIWRWNDDNRQIVNLYDTGFFIDQDQFFGDDIDLRKMQIVSSTIIVLDAMNGLHILKLNKLGKILYESNLLIDSFTTFFYDSKQELLFMGKRGRIEQYQIKILSSINYKANRIQRYHLHGFEDINQITIQNRFLYARTQQMIHVVHLTNIPSNNQAYDGMYNAYPQLYNQKMIPTAFGFIKVIASESNVVISNCETHPPFLHLKWPQTQKNFTVHAYSTLNQQSQHCKIEMSSQYVLEDEDKIYLNGYDTENETLFSNRPGRTIADLEKYGIGKNLEYDVFFYNHKIPFEYKIRKVNNQSCQFAFNKTSLADSKHKAQERSESAADGNSEDLNSKQHKDFVYEQGNFKANWTDYKIHTIGQWLVVEFPTDRVKEYYKCYKYEKITCKFITLYILTTNSTSSYYQLIQEQKTKKEYLQEVVAFYIGNQTTLLINLIGQSDSKFNLTEEYGAKFSQQKKEKDKLKQSFLKGSLFSSLIHSSEENLQSVKSLCTIKLPQGQQYNISDMKLRQDKFYIVFPHLKQIGIYESLFSLEQGNRCHYFGSINLTSFNLRQFYFAPHHIDFDKRSLKQPFLIPSFNDHLKIRKNQIRESFSQSVETVFVMQFNEILVLRTTFNSQTIAKVQLLKSIVADRVSASSNVKLRVILPYILVIDASTKTVAQYYITHTYAAYFIRNYVVYSTDKIAANVKVIDPNTIAMLTAPDSNNQTQVQVYRLNSIVSSFKQLAKFKIHHQFQMIQFNAEQFEFITVTIEDGPQIIMKCNSTTLTPVPQLIIDVPKRTDPDEPSKQQFYLTIATDKQSKRNVMTLQVASDSSQIIRGKDYPYRTFGLSIGQDESQVTYEIEDKTWFQGNIFNQRYVCQDCKNGRVTFSSKIAEKDKISLQSFNIPQEFYVYPKNNTSVTGQYNFQTIQGYLQTKMTQQNKNRTWLFSDFSQNQDKASDQPTQPSLQKALQQLDRQYTFSQSLILTSNIQNDPQCIKASPQHHDLYFVSLCEDYEFLDEQALLELRLYSNDGFKPFVIFEYLIPLEQLTNFRGFSDSTNSIKQLTIKSAPLSDSKTSTVEEYDVLFVRFQDNIWIFLILDGRLELINTIDQIDFGINDHLCWMDVIKLNTTKKQANESSTRQGDQLKLIHSNEQYGILATLCQTGLYYMVFTVDPPALTSQKKPSPSFRLHSEQQINYQSQLQKNKIQLPQHSYFLQTFVKRNQSQPTELCLYLIVQNFNSFIWKVSLMRQTIAIDGMDLAGIIRRYNEYSPIQVTSSDDRYFTVLYKSTQKTLNISEFLAVYDIQDYVIDNDRQIKQYFMYSAHITVPKNEYGHKSEIYQIGPKLFVLNENQIKILQTTNVMKVHIQKAFPKLEQSFSENPVSSIQKSLREENPHEIGSDNGDPVLYSQSVIIFVETPTEVNSVSIKIYSVDFFELTGWQITFIVVGGLILLVILYYILKKVWKVIQKRRKLVKLTSDLIDDSNSSAGEKDDSRKMSEPQDEVYKSEDEDNGNNQDSDQQPRAARQSTESQITTSDFANSVLQKRPLQEPLLEK